MRLVSLAIAFLLLATVSTAFSEPPPFRAGVVRLSVTTVMPFDVLVWYPSQADEKPWQAGPFTIPVSRSAAVASGRFPIVLLSHGGGLGGGTPLLLREISVDLARRGFVVVAPFHGKAGAQARPLQVKLALDAVLADPRLALHADPNRLGMLGFSLGGAVTLQLAGAIPNVRHYVSYCAAHADDSMSCGHAPDGENGPVSDQALAAITASLPVPLSLKAIVLLDPFGVLFQHPELAAVTMPVLLFWPGQSALPGEANAMGLAAGLPHSPQFRAIPGSHFIFVDVCPVALETSSPEVCQDPPGVNRTAIHALIEK